MIIIIYKITNLINNKIYIGQTSKNIQNRFKRHCETSKTNESMPICRAIKKHKKENFKIEEIENCYSYEEANNREGFWIKELNSLSPDGYNLRASGENKAISEETRTKIRKANLGKKISEETKLKQSIAHIGYKQTEETKKKLSLINKGKKGSDLCYRRVTEVNSKIYYFISPEGKEITIHNMKKFSKENNLLTSCMCEVANGRQIKHKGWILDINAHSIDDLCIITYNATILKIKEGKKNHKHFVKGHIVSQQTRDKISKANKRKI